MASNDFFGQLKALSENLSPGKKITLAVLLTGTLLGFAAIMLWAGRPDYQVLYSDLSMEDSAAIFQRLKEQKIPYQLSANGKTIMIPRDQVYEMRLDLASQGLPQQSSAGFELFDETKLGMTEFLQNVNYQRALQGELARTIGQFDEVESARVHLVMANKSLFVEDQEPATASVILKMRSGKWLGKEQVQGIVHLVSSSISGLKTENITVVDGNGKMLAGFNDSSGVDGVTSDQLAFQEKVEKSLETRIRTMLEKALGPERAVVRVSADIDFRRHEETEERFYPDNQVVRSEKRFNENAAGPAGTAQGIPGAVPNMSDRGQGSSAAGNSAFQKEDRTVNYEIGKMTSRTVTPVGVIQRVSVAAMVDGTYREVAGKGGKTEMKYLPRAPEELAKLESIIKGAVNFETARGDKVEVVNIPFAATPMTAEGDGDVPAEVPFYKTYAPLFKYGIVAIFVLLSFIFVIRPLVRWLTAGSMGDVEILKQLPMTVGEIERGYGEGGGFKDQALEMLNKDNETSLGVIQEWLKETP
ncbi:MAG: flagellar M-ring protein FliF [Desulfobacterales bacterium]|nr:flagellar M-ring protein FliF [Desulfobacterales bacterium]